jgi:protein-tyrosine phosphatase
MIWHETKKAAVIVMLTQLVEGPWEKCSQYFPADLENHSINVRITDEKGDDREGVVKLVETKYDEVSRTTIRQLLLTRGEHSKTIWHLFFLGWPDYGVPKDDSRDALLELIKLSRSKNESWNHPRIIHCSAGVGRSGTFIALDHLLEELDNGSMRVAKGSDDPVFDTVSTLREQRMAMVQSDLQFQIIYDLLRQEYLKTEKIQEPKTPVDEIIQTEKLPIPGGEPSPKVMRVSRGTKKVFVRDKNTRTSSDGDSNESSSIEGKAPKTP